MRSAYAPSPVEPAVCGVGSDAMGASQRLRRGLSFVVQGAFIVAFDLPARIWSRCRDATTGEAMGVKSAVGGDSGQSSGRLLSTSIGCKDYPVRQGAIIRIGLLNEASHMLRSQFRTCSLCKPLVVALESLFERVCDLCSHSRRPDTG